MRLSHSILLPLCILGLHLLCCLTQVAAEPAPIPPIDLAKCYWAADKLLERSDLYVFAPRMQLEGHGLGMSPENLIDQRLSNLATYAAAFEKDYMRYFRERHGNHPTTPPQIVPLDQLAELDSKVDKLLSASAPLYMLMQFIANHFPLKSSMQLLHQITREIHDHQATTVGSFFQNLMHKIGQDEFAKYFLSQLLESSQTDDAALSKIIFKSQEVLAFLLSRYDPESLPHALRQAKEPFSETTFSSPSQ